MQTALHRLQGWIWISEHPVSNVVPGEICTYYGVCFMHVPQDCWWDALIANEMVKSASFGYITTTRPKYVKVSFGILFVHIELVYTSSTHISIGWNICYGQIKFCPYSFSEIFIYQATQVEFDDSDCIFGISSKFEPRKHIELHM